MKLPKLKVPGAKGAEMKEIQAKYEKKVADYADLLVDDFDFDWSSIVRLIKFKLERVRDHILEHKYFVGYEKVAKEMTETIALFDRVLNDPYHDEVFKGFYKKHGKPKMVWGEKDEKGNIPVEFIFANGKPSTKAMSKETRKLYRKEAKAMQADIKAAFGSIEKNLTKWWC